MHIRKDITRDCLLTDFGKQTLKDRYLLRGEDFQDCFVRVSQAYQENSEHGRKMYEYISKLWFMPATPVLSNGGTDRGLPISCFLNEVGDSLEEIAANYDECVWLASGGGGIGTDWSRLRSMGEPVRARGHSSGIIPFIKMMDAQSLAISQGSLRRGSAAMFLHISHPEIEEFMQIRKPSGGDANRKSLNIHNGVVIPDSFMIAVKEDRGWDLIDPKSKAVKKTVDARELFQRLLELRMETGEPYLIFEDTINRSFCEYQKKLGLRVKQSNLCTEIMLHTGKDHHGIQRTAVCCLGSLNLEKFDEWKDDEEFIFDCLLFLDNVLQDFINNTEGKRGYERARYSAMRERSVGLGVMGWHSYLQSRMIPFSSMIAEVLNRNIFRLIRKRSDEANIRIADLKGPNLDAKEAGENKRFSHMLAIAPTASISIIAGGTSACIEPWSANVFAQKTLSGTFQVRNKHLKKLLEDKGLDNEGIWFSILENEGSISHIEALGKEAFEVFQTAFELDQRWVINQAADRAPFIDQGQSINLFIPPSVDKWDLLMLHYKAWEKGVKSLYYCRTKSPQRVGFAGGGVEADNTLKRPDNFELQKRVNYEECMSCQ